MSLKSVTLAGLAAALAAGAVAPEPAAAQARLSFVHPFADFLIYTKHCKRLVADIAAGSGGSVNIEVLPYNSINMFQQAGAVKAGRVDMGCVPAAFFARAVPENEVLATSNSSPARVRANGGLDMLDRIQQREHGTKLIGWTASGSHFRIYMKNPPKWTAAGLPDLKGVKLRDNPIYGAFFRALEGETHNLPPTAAYAALEKGIVDASAWATIGLRALKWDKFLRHAIEPEFYQTEKVWMMNLARWKALDGKTRKYIQDAVIAREERSREILKKTAAEERALLARDGMTFHTVPDATTYLRLAVDSAYERIAKRLKDAGRDTSHVAKLRELFQE